MISIEISINIIIFFFVIIFIITKKIALYALFLTLILIHELMHMLIGLLLGLHIKRITIIPFGFKIQMKEYKENSNADWKEIITAIAGPTINIILMVIAIVLKLNLSFIYANLLIVLFNLIPILPLDGGRVLYAILKTKLKKQRAYCILNKVSNISVIIITMLGSILILYVKNIFILFGIIYLWYILIMENKKYKLTMRVYDIIEKNNLL